MKKYPSIPYWDSGLIGGYCYAFDKLDGSNIRVEWDKKLSKKSTSTYGFRKFGTKNQMISNMNHPFSEAVDLFMEKYSTILDEIFRTEKAYMYSRKITVFLEYYGENSFAGLHDPNDEKDIVLIDVDLFQKGFVKPSQFINDFGVHGIPSIVYEGEYNEDLIEKVRSNQLGKNLVEGVVCKGVDNQKVWMCKIKCNSWLHNIKDKKGYHELLKEVNGNEKLLY